ncbi:unnamed protein product, partial [Meganyctiphanes norvegica]
LEFQNELKMNENIIAQQLEEVEILNKEEKNVKLGIEMKKTEQFLDTCILEERRRMTENSFQNIEISMTSPEGSTILFPLPDSLNVSSDKPPPVPPRKEALATNPQQPVHNPYLENKPKIIQQRSL